MSRQHFSLVLLCLSIAVCSAGVLPLNEVQNDVLNLGASEKDVSKLGKNDTLEHSNQKKKNIKPMSTNSSFDAMESEMTKIEVLNITNAFRHLDDPGQDNDKSLENEGLSSASQLSPGKLLNDSDFNTTNVEIIIKSTSEKISNETEETKWPLNDQENDTNTQVSRLQTEEIHIEQENSKGKIPENTNESFSLLPNDTSEFYLNAENSSSSMELETFPNETEVMEAGNFSDTGFFEDVELAINVTGGSQDLSNLSAVIKLDNSSDFINETEAFGLENFLLNEERNESSVHFANETDADLYNEWSLEKQNSSFTVFSNDTESLNISFKNIPNIDDENVTALDSLDVTDTQNRAEVNISNSEELENDSFILNETEVSNNNSDMIVDNKNLGVGFDVENTPIEGSSHFANEKESEGLFSNFGFDFLKNTEIAKNAAKAMEIFNLSDSITDHIIEEHEFHSFLDTAPTSTDSVDAIVPVKLPQEQIDPSIFKIDGSPEGLKPLEESNANTSEVKTFPVSEISDIEGVTLLNDSMLSDSSLNMTDPGVIKTNEVDLQLNTSESTTDFNDTLPHIDNSSIPSTSDVKVNSTAASPKCPPPGVCIFWFLAQDTCAVNSHCLGSRICCRIRCSKTCIEV